MISAAQLLDELMGRDRNLAPDEKRSNVRWDHESVCKYYLCGFCPAELFTNTRSDLGPCEKIHDENLRKQYEKSSRFMKVGYEREFLRYLQSLLAEVERRIRRGHARLALSQTQQSSGQAAGPTGKNEEKIQVLTDKIDVLLQQIEELGSEGKVEEAQGMMKLVEQLKEERELLRSTTSTIESFAAQEKQMEVCEVCGAFLIVGDAQSRVDDHLMGKQHMGYAKIKATVEELKEKLRKRTEEPERDDRLKKEKLEREEREREREREEKERKRRREEEEKEKERARDRERRKRSRSRSRHSSRTDRRGSRSRDHKRSRSKERRRSRSRDRRRSRSHDRSDRKHRSRSRDRRRSKSRDRKSYKHRSKSREREQERKSKEKEKRGSDDKKSSVKSSSREKQSEDTSMDSKEGDAKNEVNGTSEDIKSEVQRKYVQMKMDLRQVRRDTKATSEGKHSVVLQNLLRYIVLYRLFCSRFISPLVCLLGTYL
ncbi:luc7-like protein 3 isoform X3 [Ahaetulla prasina]|uniref:luc7-like protein 3 isoform X3 n=1 Tax=Ahaetulla prasina TaxID=499056 RepID=UPI00264910EB|nr:luc7-like protein 3 isoform X3 [Ahaetulla prasina]